MQKNSASQRDRRVGGSLRVYALRTVGRLWRISLALLVGTVVCAADTPEKRHNLVVALENSSCEEALTTFAETASDDVRILRPALKSHYTRASVEPLDIDLDTLWRQAHDQWRMAEFEQAISSTDAAVDALYAHDADAIPDALLSIAQLRITTLLLQGNQEQARTESLALLSKNHAEYYCADTAFPEACAHLRTLEAESSVHWTPSDTELADLSRFSSKTHQRLSTVSTSNSAMPNAATGNDSLHTDAPKIDTARVNQTSTDQASSAAAQTARIRWELVESGVRTRHHDSTGDCATQAFWQSTLHDWNALLLTEPALLPPPPAIALQRTLRIGVPIAASIVSGLAIASTVNLHQRRKRFDGCLVSAKNCETYDAIQDSKVQWVRARRMTAAAWTAVGVVGLSPIPLVLFKKRALERSKTAAGHTDVRASSAVRIDGPDDVAQRSR